MTSHRDNLQAIYKDKGIINAKEMYKMPKLVKTAKTNRVRSSTKRINDRKLNND
jgi:hypothetical protein